MPALVAVLVLMYVLEDYASSAAWPLNDVDELVFEYGRNRDVAVVMGRADAKRVLASSPTVYERNGHHCIVQHWGRVVANGHEYPARYCFHGMSLYVGADTLFYCMVGREFFDSYYSGCDSAVVPSAQITDRLFVSGHRDRADQVYSLVRFWLLRHGAPTKLHSDDGVEFYLQFESDEVGFPGKSFELYVNLESGQVRPRYAGV